MRMSDLAKRLVVVTGGGTGIGRAIAADFAADGARVVLLGRRPRVLEEAVRTLQRADTDADLQWRCCDVGNADEVDAFARWLTTEVGPTVDVLVNNAGGTGSIAAAAPTRDAAAHAQEMLAANLVGGYLMVHALRPHLRRPGGRVVNISSIAAVRGGGGMYSAAKAGLIGLTYALAGDLGPEGVTVNAVAPGLILDTEFFGDRMTDERVGRIVAQTPLGRPGRPTDIVAAVRYLASEEASFVTGEVHHVNGGWAFGR